MEKTVRKHVITQVIEVEYSTFERDFPQIEIKTRRDGYVDKTVTLDVEQASDLYNALKYVLGII